MNTRIKEIVFTACLIFSGTVGAQDTTQIPDGYILVEEGIIDLFIDEPNASFLNAVTQFENKDYEGSAQDIRRASAVLRIEGQGFANEGSNLRVREAAVRLESLADRVEKELITDVYSLHTAFAHVHQVLGTANTMEGKLYWEQNAEQETRKALNRARTRLGHAADWSKAKLSDLGTATMDEIDAVTVKTKLGAENVAKWFKALEVEASTLGESIEDTANK